MKGATPKAVSTGEQLTGFNPRAREGRDREIVFHKLLRTVSIHAPVKGATREEGRGVTRSQVSIHAPVKGATAVPVDATKYGQFQSTRP